NSTLWNNFQIYVPNLQKLPVHFKLVLSSIECSPRTINNDLKHISYFAKLQHLNLHGCEKITDTGLQHLIKLTSFQLLDLGGCKQITDHGLKHLGKLTTLLQLSLLSCYKITDH